MQRRYAVVRWRFRCLHPVVEPKYSIVVSSRLVIMTADVRTDRRRHEAPIPGLLCSRLSTRIWLRFLIQATVAHGSVTFRLVHFLTHLAGPFLVPWTVVQHKTLHACSKGINACKGIVSEWQKLLESKQEEKQFRCTTQHMERGLEVDPPYLARPIETPSSAETMPRSLPVPVLSLRVGKRTALQEPL